MTYVDHQFAGDPSEMSRLDPHACHTCQEPDGTPNTDYLNENGQCTFGCGRVVDRDTGVCEHCQDHSCNEVECEECGRLWQRWGTWETNK